MSKPRALGRGLRPNPDAGFTLVELLVAATLTVLIAGVLVGLIANLLANWDRSGGVLTAENEARDVLDRIQLDLHGAWSREDGGTWLVATIQADASASGVWEGGGKPSAGSLNPAAVDLAAARFGLAGVWLRFFTVSQITQADGLPAPVAVSYQIVRRAPTPVDSPAHYLLYRSEVASDQTMAAGYELGSAVYTTASEAAGEPGNLVRPGRRQVLADKVIDFGVRLYAYQPDPDSGSPMLRQVFPVGAADLEFRARSPRSPTEPRHLFPAVLEVLIRVLTAEGARRLSAFEAGQMTGDWWEIANEHSRVFVRRIQLKADLP